MKKGVAKLGQKTYSAVAGASYRSGSKFYDARNNLTHDYSNRSDIYQSKIFLPDEAQNCDWAKDREKLWNMVESSETRQTAVLYREVILSLPRELKPDANIAMVGEFIRDKFTSRGMIADVSFHDMERNHNPLVHIMLTTRRVSEDGTGFSKHKERDWDKNYVKDWRDSWAKLLNDNLTSHNIHQRVSAKKIKTDSDMPHIPRDISEMEKRGVATNKLKQIMDKWLLKKNKNIIQNRNASKQNDGFIKRNKQYLHKVIEGKKHHFKQYQLNQYQKYWGGGFKGKPV